MKKTRYITSVVGLLALLVLFVQCNNEPTTEAEEATPLVTIEKAHYGMTPEGDSVAVFTLKNEKGMELQLITYGGIISSWKAPNKDGVYEDIVLGYETLDQYLASNPYFGALIGRYGNRIANGKFSIGETEYQLTVNDGSNHLHGGAKGFDKVVWNAIEMKTDSTASLQLSYLSPDGEEGYPGNLQAKVVYTLTNDNVLDVHYEATTDQTTIVNLTQHSYFNLSADFSRTILDHELVLNADQFLPVDETLIPTGELRAVDATPFDFRESKTIGQDIEVENEQLTKGRGYDHCWVLNGQESGMRFAASAYHPESGRFLEIFTDEPGMQFYCGNFLDGTLPMKGGGTYAHRTGFCLETQHYPDSPNQPDFPSVWLEPGKKYESRTSFRFSVK